MPQVVPEQQSLPPAMQSWPARWQRHVPWVPAGDPAGMSHSMRPQQSMLRRHG